MSWNHFIYSRERLVFEALKLLQGIWPCVGDDIGGRMLGIRLNNVAGRLENTREQPENGKVNETPNHENEQPTAEKELVQAKLPEFVADLN